jgi:uncharacterized OB-fold protein
MTLLNPDDGEYSPMLGDLPVTSRYTYGIAGERFFLGIKDDAKFYGTKCPRCELVYVPGVLFCERCLSELTEWIDVGTAGELFSYTIIYLDYDGSKLDAPKAVGFIKIRDGGLIHLLEETDFDQLLIGMEVEPVFKDKKDRIGSITDIKYFRPVNI